MIGIGRDQFSLHSAALSAPPEPVLVDFPVDVRAIVVRGDEQARRSIRALTIEPQFVVAPAARLSTEPARRAVRYRSATAFFLDDRSFPEPEAFWVGGGRTSGIVFQPDDPASACTALFRNAPIDNRVVIQSGAWRLAVQLGPGEERRVSLPLDAARRATLFTISSSAGFRPSAVDPKSRDDRFLGVWIRMDPDR
jgi:hypothetical protein